MIADVAQFPHIKTEQTEISIPTESIETSELAKAGEETKKTNLTTEETVKAYFHDIPVMATVAFCESTFRHYDANGNVLRGVVNGSDVGVMQINTYYHGSTAEKLGLDLTTVEGNMEYARYLYETQGTAPWIHSKHCWNSNQHVALR